MPKKKVVVDPMGQWNNPGDITIIPSNSITMQGVNYPVLGIDNLGNQQMMMPGGSYTFPGDYVTEIPQMGKGGLTQWFAEEWTDIKTGKPCGRQEGEKRAYPACRPKKRVNETTPKTSSEMSSAEKAKFKRSKTSGERISYNHKRKEYGGENWLDTYQDGGQDPALPTDPVSLNNTRKFYEQWYASPRYNEMLRKSTNTIEPVEITKKLTLADKAGRLIRKTTPEIAKWYLGTQWPEFKKEALDKKRKQEYQQNEVVDTLPIDTGLTYDQISSGRNQNLGTTPTSVILHSGLEDQGIGGYSDSTSGQIHSDPAILFNSNNWYLNSLLPHELSHSTDRPLANSNERLIPQADIDQIKSRINLDTDPLHSAGRRLHIPEFWSDYGSTPIEGAVNYFSSPTEVRARLNDIRYNLNKAGVDIFNKPVTQEDLDQLNTRTKQGLYELQGIYPKEDILWLLNNISKNDSSKESNYAQVGGSINWLDTYQDGGKVALRTGNTFDDEIFNPFMSMVAGALDTAGEWTNDFLGSTAESLKNNLVSSPFAPMVWSTEAKAKPWLFENVRPVQYPGIVSSAIALGMGAAGATRPPVRDPQGDYDIGEEAWRRALGLETKPKYIVPSKYKPSKSTDPNAQYYTLGENIIDPALIIAEAKKRNLQQGQSAVIDSLAPYIREGYMPREEFSQIDPLQKFTIGMGQDAKGKYVSIYDKYDFQGPLNSFINPYEFYDRYYYKQGGSTGWLNKYN